MKVVEIKVQTYLDAVDTWQYQVQNFTADAADFAAQEMAANLRTMFDTFSAQVATGALVHSELTINDFKVELETGIINLPFANNNRVDNFYANLNQAVPVVVNLIVEAPNLNASAFHIDTLGPVDQIGDAMFEQMCVLVQAAWTTAQAPAEAPTTNE